MLVKFNSPRVVGFKDVLIIPGINDLSPDFVAEMQEDSILAGKFDNGELEILEAGDVGAEKVKTKKAGGPTGIDLLLAASEKSAKTLATQTVDLVILKKWLLREKRGVIKKAVKDQIAKIENIQYRDEKSKQKFEKSMESGE